MSEKENKFKDHNLVVYPNPILRKKCDPIDPWDPDLIDLISRMVEVMEQHGGVGLAAPQIGVSKRVFIFSKFHGTPRQQIEVYINPQVVETSKENVVSNEGCLSFPGGLFGLVSRPKWVRCQAISLTDKHQNMELVNEEIDAVAFFHELDHLDGKCLIDRMGKLEKRNFLKKYSKLNRSS